MRLRSFPLALLLLCLAAPAFAVSNWYDYYLDARDKHIPNKRWKEALAGLSEAVKLMPESSLNERTYNMYFVPYFPYYYEGLCYLRMGDYNTAIRMFNIEEKNGKIQGAASDFREMLKLRQEAVAAQGDVDKAQQVRKLRETVDDLKRKAAEQDKAGNFVDALSNLNTASKLAEVLDPATQKAVQDQIQKTKDDKERAEKEEQAQARSKRIDRNLAEGAKLLEEGHPTEAKLRFDEVLKEDAGNVGALNGKRSAEEAILASTTRAEREVYLREGRALFEAARYEEAMRPLAEAAADPSATEAQQLLDRARKYLEGFRHLKETRGRIDDLLREADALMQQRKYSDAWVRLEAVLGLDPSNPKAKDGLLVAQRRTGEQAFEHYFPNTPPVLTFLAPPGTGPVVTAETQGQKFDIGGVAQDDRGLARIQVLVDGQLVSDQEMVPDATGELPRSQRVERTFDLKKGPNQIRVVAVDSLGARQEQTFQVTRQLQIHEQAWFLPSAVGTAAGLVGLGFMVQRSRRRRAVRNRFNPYIAGAPVLDEDMFFGRQKLLARIMNVLHHNSLMITGERRIGKTTLLHHLKRALERDEGTEYQFFPISTDLQGVPESGFFHAVMNDVVEGVQPRPETLAELRFAPEREAYDGRDFSHDLQRVIEDLKRRTRRKVKLALLIDEVDVLNEYSERVNQRLRSIFMKTFSEHLVAIMSGVGIRRIWNSEGSPWYNFFDEIELTAFTREEGEALVREPVEGTFRYEPEAVETILSQSELKPYVIQKFCIHALNHMLEEGRTTITAGDVEAVRDTVQFERPEEVASVASRASA